MLTDDEELNDPNFFDFRQEEVQTFLTRIRTVQSTNQNGDPNQQQSQQSVDVPVFCEFPGEDIDSSIQVVSTMGLVQQKGSDLHLPLLDPSIYFSDFDTPIHDIVESSSNVFVNSSIRFSASSSGAASQECGERTPCDSHPYSLSSYSGKSPAEYERELQHLPGLFEDPIHLLNDRNEETQQPCQSTEAADPNTVYITPLDMNSFQLFEAPHQLYPLTTEGTRESYQAVQLADGGSNKVNTELLGGHFPTSCQSPICLQSNGETQESFQSVAGGHDHSDFASTSAQWQSQSEQTHESLNGLEELLTAEHHADCEDHRHQLLGLIVMELENYIESAPESTTDVTNEDNLELLIVTHRLFPHIIDASVAISKIGANEDEGKQLDNLVRLHFPQLDAPEQNLEDELSCFGRDPRLDLCLEKYLQLLVEFKLDIEKVVASAATFCQQMKQKILIQCPELDTPSGDSFGPKHSETGSVSGDVEEEDVSFKEAEDPETTVNDQAQATDRASSSRTTPQSLTDEEWRGRILAAYDQSVLTNLKKKHLKEGRKNAKLPEPARILLTDWWGRHAGNPYPTEEEKLALTEKAGLEIDQINNWFINQRKRHCCTVFSETHQSHAPDCYKMTTPRR